MRLLAISDKTVDFLYSQGVQGRFGDVDFVVSCGDLPYYYLEYLLNALDRPLFFVRGNHEPLVEHTSGGPRTAPWGAVDLHGQTVNHEGLLLAGFQGSIRYKPGPFQYSDLEMRLLVLQAVPSLLLNRARYGRYLDILVTHSPPRGVQDQPDRTHRGFAAFRWFLSTFQPRWMLHGHIHVYHPNLITRSTFGQTEVINCYGYRELELDFDLGRPQP